MEYPVINGNATVRKVIIDGELDYSQPLALHKSLEGNWFAILEDGEIYVLAEQAEKKVSKYCISVHDGIYDLLTNSELHEIAADVLA